MTQLLETAALSVRSGMQLFNHDILFVRNAWMLYWDIDEPSHAREHNESPSGSRQWSGDCYHCRIIL